MTIADEINLLMEKLTEAWGSVVVACDGEVCVIANGNAYAENRDGLRVTYEAPTLLEALRLAEQAGEV